jgi:tetratricopeptide (TPR) repeat protein
MSGTFFLSRVRNLLTVEQRSQYLDELASRFEVCPLEQNQQIDLVVDRSLAESTKQKLERFKLQDDWKGLEEYLSILLEKNPQHKTLLALAGQVSLKNNNQESAFRYLSRLEALGRCDHVSYSNLGVVYMRQRKTLSALTYFLKALLIERSHMESWLNAAFCFTELGMHEDAEQCFRSALLEKTHLTTWQQLLFARNLNANRKYSEATEILKTILSKDPLNTSATVTLSEILLHGLNKPDDALHNLTQLLAVNETSQELEVILAQVYLAKGNSSEALMHARRAIGLGDDARANFVFADCLYEEGHYEQSIRSIRDAIRCSIDFKIQDEFHFPQIKKPYMDVGAAEKTLVKMRNALDEIGIPFFLVFGTLLGVIRSGELLPFDKDMDIGLQWNISRTNLVASLNGFGFVLHRSNSMSNYQALWNLAVVDSETGIAIDLFFFRPTRLGSQAGFFQKPFPVLWEFPVFKLEWYEWKGVRWRVPGPPEHFLKSIYGPDWLTPDPNFETVVSAYNLSQDSHIAARQFGYRKLLSRILNRQWEKAESLCQQIERFGYDPYLNDLAEWIRQTQRKGTEYVP